MKRIVLASQSARRKEILEKLGIPFEVVPSDFEEDMTLKMPPAELVKTLALGKAEAVAKNYKDALVIGADTVVALDGVVYGKQKNAEEAERTLKTLSGRCHSVFTGFVVIDTTSGKKIIDSVETRVYFRDLSEEEIKKYAATDEAREGAGAYMLQKHGGRFIERIEGDYFNIIGLPLVPLILALRGFSIEV